MRYVAWSDRTAEAVSPQQDRLVRESAASQGFKDLPDAYPGWASDRGWGTTYSSERFAGARPVWIWESK